MVVTTIDFLKKNKKNPHTENKIIAVIDEEKIHNQEKIITKFKKKRFSYIEQRYKFHN